MEQRISQFFDRYLSGIYFPEVSFTDVLEILILTYLVYKIMVWIKNTKAWMLMRGLMILFGFILVAAILQMHTILFIARYAATVMATAVIVVFQPELRRGLEKIGQGSVFGSVMPFEMKEKGRFSSETVHGIVEASYEMGRAKTGALIVVERNIQLSEYESTGIKLDCLVSSQVLINIFEHNTPLHDGAIIVRNDRIVAATCYLPLSDNMELSKDLGTRHRAAVGMSEVSDALVIVVSEETGKVSIAEGGKLKRGIPEEELREKLEEMQNKSQNSKGLLAKWKGRLGNDR